MYVVGMGPMRICKISGDTKLEVKDKIVEASTGSCVSDTKEVLTKTLLGGVGDTDDNANNFGAVPIGRVEDSTEWAVNSEIVKVLTEIEVDNAKKILTRALPGKMEDVVDVAEG